MSKPIGGFSSARFVFRLHHAFHVRSLLHFFERFPVRSLTFLVRYAISTPVIRAFPVNSLMQFLVRSPMRSLKFLLRFTRTSRIHKERAKDAREYKEGTRCNRQRNPWVNSQRM
jgi:hypothetical protein